MIRIPAHQRVRPGRKPLAEEKICAHDLVQMAEIGVEVSEQLDIIPAQVRVLRHVRKKYACPECQQGVKTAALPPQPLPKSMASPGLLAHITVAKYQDALGIVNK